MGIAVGVGLAAFRTKPLVFFNWEKSIGIKYIRSVSLFGQNQPLLNNLILSIHVRIPILKR